jgi:NTE family protein
MTVPTATPKIGLALGSGSARGMAHLGVIDQLRELGIEPDIICGSSVGALIGAVSLLGKGDEFARWITALSAGDILHYMDIRLATTGGFAHGGKLMQYLRESLGETRIEELDKRFAAVATDLKSGREIWLQSGSIWDAVRASIALPGIMTPVLSDGIWLVDGGLVNPVPVSVCRAMGADIIIAVNLNGDLVGRHLQAGSRKRAASAPEQMPVDNPQEGLLDRWTNNIREKAQPLLQQWLGSDQSTPGVFDVMASSINIMQDRITRSRLAGEPADYLLNPCLGHIGLLEFNRAPEAIREGRQCVERHFELVQLCREAREIAAGNG